MEGDREHFTQLFHARFRSIARFIRTKVDDPALAEDLAPEVFTIAWDKHRTGTTITGGWLLAARSIR